MDVFDRTGNQASAQVRLEAVKTMAAVDIAASLARLADAVDDVYDVGTVLRTRDR